MEGDTTNKISKEKSHAKTITKQDRNLEKILIENFISMQKVMTGLAVKFDHLTKQIENLLDLFEGSAKALTEKEINLELKGDTAKQEDIINDLKKLLDQNKLIAKGITLMHDSATNPQTEYAIGTAPERPAPQPVAPPQAPVAPHNMTASQKMPQQSSFTTPEVTSPIKTPQVVEESTPSSPNFQI